MPTERVAFLGIEFDTLSMTAVLDALAVITERSPFQYLVTPNTDHVVMLDRNTALKLHYRRAAICLCDSRILRRLASLAGVTLSLVPGSDLTRNLFLQVIRPRDRITIVGGNEELLASLRQNYPAVDFLHHRPPMGLKNDPVARQAAAAFIAGSHARFTLIAVGAPQQEAIALEALKHGEATGMALCVGASLEFLTGQQKRAPKMMQRLGLEWLHRLAANPERLWRRYLVDDMKIFGIFIRSFGFKNWFKAIAVAILFAGAASLAGYAWSINRSAPTPHHTSPVLQRLELAPISIHLPPPDLVRALSPAQAAQENAQRPFTARPDEPAKSFRFGAEGAARQNALTCLSQAVYYEAASEGIEGGRAIAQIILNRVRHPGFPATVCGVVYEGSDRVTGCQFSFTCDGSLLRPPVEAIFHRSRKIAEKALAGDVFAAVGHSTHYHADYVLPYWADSLDKTIQIGRHIFYRLRGALGDARLFRKAYGGLEVVPQPASLAQILGVPDGAVSGDSANLFAEEIAGKHSVPSEVVPAGEKPIVDLARGTLLVDELQPIRPSTPRKSVTCSQPAESGQLKPMGADKWQVGSASPVC